MSRIPVIRPFQPYFSVAPQKSSCATERYRESRASLLAGPNRSRLGADLRREFELTVVRA